MISNCGHDENGKYSGGKAGDQGGEWTIRTWYNRPWTVVLRHPDAKVRSEICKKAIAAAKNDDVGYDQSQRETYWTHLKASDYDPSKITVKCEADCSSGVSSNVKATGYTLKIEKLKNVSIGNTTSTLKSALKNAGFEVLTASKYLTSDAYLLKGDILLCEGHHVCTNVTNGSKATSTNVTKTYTTVKKTSSTSAIKWMQKRLNTCYTGNLKDLVVDGIWGSKTTAMLKAYWKQLGWKKGSYCGKKTCKALKNGRKK